MNQFFFWTSWKRPYGTFYVLLLLLFLCTIAATGFAYLFGNDYAIGWDIIGEWKTIPLVTDIFQVNQFDIPQESEQYLLQQTYAPAEIKIHPWVSYLHMGLIVFALLILLTAITYLELWMYITGMAVFMYYLVSMHTELLGLFGEYSRTGITAFIILYGAITYYFHAFGERVSFSIRFLLLLLCTAALAGVIQSGSVVNVPFLYTSNFSLTIPIMLSIAFMFMVSYYLIQLFVTITSYGKSSVKASGRNPVWNFIAIGLLYLGNVFVLWLKRKFYPDLDLAYLQPFVLLALSSVAGIWMYREKNDSSVPFNPLGGFIYLALGIITFSTISLGYMTANDALINTLEYCVIYTHLGTGIAVFLYVLVNFWLVYQKNQEAYKVFFEPVYISFLAARAAGAVIIIILFFYSHMYVYYSSLAAYYNHTGDVYAYTRQPELAKAHYDQAYQWEFQNQRTSYALGKLYEQDEDDAHAFEYYQSALNKNPSVFAFVQLSTFYVEHDQLFPAIFMLKDGLKVHPDNPYLLNNLGYLYQRFNPDSSAWFFQAAIDHGSDELPAANLLAFYAGKGNFTMSDSIIQTYPDFRSMPFLANKTGAETMSGKPTEGSSLPASILTDTVLDANAFTLLYNYAFSKLAVQDSSLIALLNRDIQHPENEFFKAKLMYAKAVQLFYSRTDVPRAIQIMDELAHTDGASLFIRTLAGWQLKCGLYAQAYESYQMLATYPDQRYVAYRCLAAFEKGKPADVMSTVDELMKSQIPQAATIAATLNRACQKPDAAALQSVTDKEKVQWLHYYVHTASAADYSLYSTQIKDPAQSILFDIEYIHTLNKRNEFTAAMESWNRMAKPESISPVILAKANLAYLQILAGLQQWPLLKNEIGKTDLLPQDTGYRNYFAAQAAQHSGDTLQAIAYYRKAIHQTGYDPKIQIDYANLIAAAESEAEALDILVEAKRTIAYSVPLSMAYIQLCIKAGFMNSAEAELTQIQDQLSKEQIDAIKAMLVTRY